VDQAFFYENYGKVKRFYCITAFEKMGVEGCGMGRELIGELS